jgi:hypothetical protein
MENGLELVIRAGQGQAESLFEKRRFRGISYDSL